MPTDTKHRIPRRVVWTLFDPLDRCVLMVAEIPIRTMEDVRRVRRMIQRAPRHFRAMGRPDGRPIGLRSLRTHTQLVYHAEH